ITDISVTIACISQPIDICMNSTFGASYTHPEMIGSNRLRTPGAPPVHRQARGPPDAGQSVTSGLR
ncbi:hypothetical protein, partial [Streptomyces sp. NPDC001876]|uniref:hypothetical protein n=1 Tax=Streptomyces sp. NPDC001876 TaxID=3154402 RepID=UPI00331E413C